MNLRHGRIQLTRRYAFVWHVVDGEPWRDDSCAECGQRFTEDPRFSFMATRLHFDCSSAYIDRWYAENGDDYGDDE